MTEVIGTKDWQGKTTRDLFPPELAEKMIEDDRHSLEAGYVVTEEQVPNTDGQVRHYQTHKFRIPRQGQPPLLGGISVDITERKQMENQIFNLAYFDPLTNLPNRRMLLDRLAHALSQAKHHQRSLAIMFLDLDNFKKINDTLGHDVGDELLKAVAVRLNTCIRTGDTVSRQGGDEFIIVLSEITHPDDAALVADKIIKVINNPVRIADSTLNVTTSIGIAVYPINGGDDTLELMKKADKAMYAAKQAGRNSYKFFVD
jgi:diguanylate cyclase (GGDEF)-like protein